jgi:DNA polymerase-3 subunit delta'
MIYGHEFQKSYFKKVIENDKLGQCYIFEGKEGIGKKLFALYLAKYFYCEKRLYFRECNCKSCQNVMSYNHPYVLFINEDQLKIDVIRSLNEFIYLGGGLIRFVIIDSIHKIPREAGSSFLRALEESPLNVVFILLTNNYSGIINTIRSRCLKLPFNRLKKEDMSFLFNKFNQEELIQNYFWVDSLGDLNKSKELFELKSFHKNDIKPLCEIILKITDKDKLKNFLYSMIFYIKQKSDQSLSLQSIEIFDFLYLLIKRIDENVNIEIVKSLTIILILEVFNGSL